MNRMAIAIVGAGVGAGVMYLCDPARGRGRRARIREAGTHVVHQAQTIAGKTARDVEHRLGGTVVRARRLLLRDSVPPDGVLIERVRARLGRLVSHPGALKVTATNGTVTLSGPVFAGEVEQLVTGVAAVAGVKAIDNQLQAHEVAAHVSALQGPGPRHVPSRSERFRWTPAARFVAGIAGLTLLALSSPSRPIRGAATGITGVELIERALFGSQAS